ncbi:MAG: hypothetical protein ACRDIV_15755 [Ktedonobacteraceae bacterium]
MPTQEERLSVVEKFQTIAAAHIRETEENTTILLGVIREYGRDIKRTFQRLEIIDGRLDSLESDLDAVKGDLGAVKGHLNTIDGRLDGIDGRLNGIDGRLEAQGKKLDQVLLLLTTQSTKPIQETE